MAGRLPAGLVQAAWLGAGAAYALGAAATTPFTWAADVLTGIPIVLLVAVAVVRWPWHPEPIRVEGRHPFRAWAVYGVVLLAWELATYAARGDRGAHPTLSSMADALDRHYLVKALAFFAWLCLCAGVARAGRTRKTA